MCTHCFRHETITSDDVVVVNHDLAFHGKSIQTGWPGAQVGLERERLDRGLERVYAFSDGLTVDCITTNKPLELRALLGQ